MRGSGAIVKPPADLANATIVNGASVEGEVAPSLNTAKLCVSVSGSGGLNNCGYGSDNNANCCRLNSSVTVANFNNVALRVSGARVVMVTVSCAPTLIVTLTEMLTYFG